MRLLISIAIAIGLTGGAGGHALAQATTNAAITPTTSPTPTPPTATPDNAWSFSANAYAFFVPDSVDYVQPTFTADRDWLHFEARYNYENLDTGSAWIGYNFSMGKKLSLEITPMLGGVFGDTAGVAPGYKTTLSWRNIELYSEGEYVFDSRDSSENFFYTWSELTLAPVDWLRFGLVVQRTKAYETDFDIQRGLLIGFTYKRVDVTTYVFNPDMSRPTVVLGVAVNF